MKYLIKIVGEESYWLGRYLGVTKNKELAHHYNKDEAEDSVKHQMVLVEMIPTKQLKILILGDARHGKDTMAEMINKNFGLTHLSSSVAALRIFLFDVLRDKYNLEYNSLEEAYEDRVNHRDKWFNEICDYNKEDPIRLTKEILKQADMYVGLRDYKEVEKAIEENQFDYIFGIFDPRKPRESKASNTADVFKYSDIVIINNEGLDELEEKIKKFLPL